MGHAHLKRRREFPGATHFPDRHGVRRWRYREKGFTAQLGRDYGSDDFVRRYEAALKHEKVKGGVGQDRTRPGTINELVAAFYATPKFIALEEVSKIALRNQTEWFRQNFGNHRVAKLKRRHIMDIIANMADTPVHANFRLSVIRRLMNLAIMLEMRPDNPTKGIEKYTIDSDGYHTWTEDEIAQYYEVHKLGSLPYLAMTLMLWTAAARGDAVRLGSDNVKDGKLTYRRQKTRRVSDIVVKVPIHKDLVEALALLPDDVETFIVGVRGGSLTPMTLTNKMRKWCDAAGLPQCTCHGLRKACATRLANLGCSPHQIMAWTGHATLAMVQRYTLKTNREGLADAAFEKITKQSKRENVVVNLSKRLANGGGK